jgi:ferritin-like metal-binding protein YciE
MTPEEQDFYGLSDPKISRRRHRAEKSFETQLTGFADEASLPQARELFERHADETRRQYQSLTTRLETLGGSPSGPKSFLAHLFNLSPIMALLGHEGQERATQDLIMAYAVENAEVAMYEALSIAAEAAGDTETSDLARRINRKSGPLPKRFGPSFPLRLTEDSPPPRPMREPARPLRVTFRMRKPPKETSKTLWLALVSRVIAARFSR